MLKKINEYWQTNCILSEYLKAKFIAFCLDLKKKRDSALKLKPLKY